jgi:hypothetical protein
VVVVHGADKTKAMACMDKMKGQAKDKAEITQDGDVTIITPKSGEPFAFSFINNDTALVVLGAKANAAGFKTVAAGGSALRTSQAFIELFNKLDTQDSVWMLMNGNSPAFDQLAALGVKPKAVYGSANVTDGVTVDFRLTRVAGSGDPDGADGQVAGERCEEHAVVRQVRFRERRSRPHDRDRRVEREAADGDEAAQGHGRHGRRCSPGHSVTGARRA